MTTIALVPRLPRRLILDVTISGQPTAQPRARVTRKGAYTPQKAKAEQDRVQWELRAMVPKPVSGSVAVEASFFMNTTRRVDLDNLWKLVSDAGNRVVWVDDCQIVELFLLKRLDRARPRIELKAWELDNHE